MNKRFALISFAVATVWTVAVFFVLPPTEVGHWIALVMTFGGMLVAFYNYMIWVDNMRKGLSEFDITALMSGLPH